MPAPTSSAVSHVGKIRANNQDSGYVGGRLFLVADGVGGHAGGDVASAIATKRIAESDQSYSTAHDAEFALQSALIAANQLLAETVFEHPELTGMGTTVSALLRVGDQMVMAHIGDSRVYRLRDGKIEQLSADHTFVQRLVDSGRITPEEAAVHPRRSVLMRVLGDVDAAPEIDTAVFDTRPGDRWLVCSDGLSSYVPEDRIAAILGQVEGAEQAAFRLVKESLDHGAPDNVTVVLADVAAEPGPPHPPRFVGSAAVPLSFEGETGRRPLRLPTLLLHPLKATQPDPSHFEPESDDYLDELIAEDRRRSRNRRILWLVMVAAAVVAIVAAVVLAYQWTQSHYFVGNDRGTVAIYQGVQQDIGPIKLSSVKQSTRIRVSDLPPSQAAAVRRTINADGFADARAIVDRLSSAARSD